MQDIIFQNTNLIFYLCLLFSLFFCSCFVSFLISQTDPKRGFLFLQKI
uniref:Uncharacterized protein n=1 Tax=Meloidogyne enterolobii TaxID=390850 RepID=A0A6V7XZ47_MELEN|nr:unnamed protein product [Meloidogyne enterolobii]